MKKTTIRQCILSLMAAAVLFFPVGASSQTVRGDFNYDGKFNISDVTALIGYILGGEWDAAPKDLVRDTLTVNRVQFVMVHVPGGTIELEEGVTGTVPDFCIGQTEVTQRLWKAVMGSNPSSCQFYQDLPVENVSWDACQEFISRLNELTGLEFRLPTSLEWTFAASGGTRSRGFLYSGSENPLLVAWHTGNASTSPSIVARLTPNELGLYDMSGNVNEWCSNASTQVSGHRVIRGGSYYVDSWQCTVTWSGHSVQNKGTKVTGLRLAL